MPQRTTDHSPIRSNHPLVREFALIVAVLLGIYLWQRVLRESLPTVLGSSPGDSWLLVNGLLFSGLLIAGLAVFAGAYVTLRDIEIGLALPSRDDLRLVSLAAVVPASLVGITKLVGVLTAVPYNSLTISSYAANTQVTTFLLFAGLSLLVGVPSLLVICQVLIQGSFERVVDGDLAIVLTTVLTGFVMMSNTGGLAPTPDQGKLVGVVLFVLALGVALYGTERIDREWLGYLLFIPVALLSALVVLSGVAVIDSIAGGLFAFTHVAVLGIGAYTYERTSSLLVPALAYVSLLLTNELVIFAFEAGMQNW